MSVALRSARRDDVAALGAFEAQFFGVDAWDEGSLLAELEGPGRRVLVAESDGELVGYAVSLAAGDMVDLTRIGVADEHRRTGVAGRLLDGLLEETGEADRMLLEVSSANPGAIAFYERHGFARISARARYYRDGSDAVIMLRPLRVGEENEDSHE